MGVNIFCEECKKEFEEDEEMVNVIVTRDFVHHMGKRHGHDFVELLGKWTYCEECCEKQEVFKIPLEKIVTRLEEEVKRGREGAEVWCGKCKRELVQGESMIRVSVELKDCHAGIIRVLDDIDWIYCEDCAREKEMFEVPLKVCVRKFQGKESS